MGMSAVVGVPETTIGVRPELETVFTRLNELVLGKELQVKLSLTCLLAGGHLLIDDLPGMGKTVLSHSLAKVLGLDYKRVQFTNDLIPADILGASIYEKELGKFRFVPGPVFCQFLLADEINRASSKTQSALLEAMEEKQVTLEGETRVLPQPFFVIATQNPVEQLGTTPLPESQLDRFMFKLSMGYPERTAELAVFGGENRREMLEEQEALLIPETLKQFQSSVAQVYCSEELLNYLYELVLATRQTGDFVAGISTRGGLAVLSAARAWAWMHGSDNVLPCHLQQVFPWVAAHRLQYQDRRHATVEDIRQLVSTVAIPR